MLLFWYWHGFGKSIGQEFYNSNHYFHLNKEN